MIVLHLLTFDSQKVMNQAEIIIFKEPKNIGKSLKIIIYEL